VVIKHVNETTIGHTRGKRKKEISDRVENSDTVRYSSKRKRGGKEGRKKKRKRYQIYESM
jgi:hypothetical protein